MKPRSILQDLGFTKAAETLNGRLAMIAITTAILAEVVTGKGFLTFLRLM